MEFCFKDTGQELWRNASKEPEWCESQTHSQQAATPVCQSINYLSGCPYSAEPRADAQRGAAAPFSFSDREGPRLGRGHSGSQQVSSSLSGGFLHAGHHCWDQERRAYSCAAVPFSGFNCVQLFETPWTVARQAPPSMGFPRQGAWRELPFPPLGAFPNPEMEPESPALQVDSSPLSHPEALYSYRKKEKKVKSLSRVRLFATPWTVARQVPLSMGFSRQAYWSGLPFPSPGDLPNPGIEPGSPALQADALSSEPPGKPLLGEETIFDGNTRNRSWTSVMLLIYQEFFKDSVLVLFTRNIKANL